MNFGRQLRSLRRDKGISLRKLSQACGLHRGRLSVIESGHDNVTLKTLYAIAEALDTKPGLLLNPELQRYQP